MEFMVSTIECPSLTTISVLGNRTIHRLKNNKRKRMATPPLRPNKKARAAAKVADRARNKEAKELAKQERDRKAGDRAKKKEAAKAAKEAEKIRKREVRARRNVEKAEQKKVAKAEKAKRAEQQKNKGIQYRKADTEKHLLMWLLRYHLEPSNLPFDEEAKKKKKEIFGEEWETTCIWTGKRGLSTNSGALTKGLSKDHIWPVRGAFRKTGLYGSDSPWNICMVTPRLNTGFKIFNHEETHGWKKDIGYQTLTTDEYTQCTEKEKSLYDKLRRWRDYAVSRGAHYAWDVGPASNEYGSKMAAFKYYTGNFFLQRWTTRSDKHQFYAVLNAFVRELWFKTEQGTLGNQQRSRTIEDRNDKNVQRYPWTEFSPLNGAIGH
jgi:hypothetical protein